MSLPFSLILIGDMVHCTDLLQSLIKYKMASPEISRLPGHIIDLLDAQYSFHFPEMKALKCTSSSRQYLIKQWAASRIAQFLRVKHVKLADFNK